MKILNPGVHGALDYLLALAFLAAPRVLDFPYPADILAYLIGAIYLGASLLTKYPLGALKVIPFPVHGLIETIMAVSWLVIPWTFGFLGHAAARNFYMGAGLGLLLVVALTDYRSSAARVYRGAERRSSPIDRRRRALARSPHEPDRRAGLQDRRRYAVAA